MAQDSKRKRYLRRVKRENTLLWREVEKMQHHLNMFSHAVGRMQAKERYRGELAQSPEEGV